MGSSINAEGRARDVIVIGASAGGIRAIIEVLSRLDLDASRRIVTFLFIRNEETTMLWTIAAVLMVLWVLGLATSYTLGGLIHVLLLFAILSLAVQIIRGRTARA